jgi:hypothetical protein
MTKSSFKDTSNQFNSEQPVSTKPKKQQDHLIEINGGAHPTHMIIPNKGVTLITNGGAVKKSNPQSNSYTNPKHVIGYQQNSKKRMSRAQYAATIAVSISLIIPL